MPRGRYIVHSDNITEEKECDKIYRCDNYRDNIDFKVYCPTLLETDKIELACVDVVDESGSSAKFDKKTKKIRETKRSA